MSRTPIRYQVRIHTDEAGVEDTTRIEEEAGTHLKSRPAAETIDVVAAAGVAAAAAPAGEVQKSQSTATSTLPAVSSR